MCPGVSEGWREGTSPEGSGTREEARLGLGGLAEEGVAKGIQAGEEGEGEAMSFMVGRGGGGSWIDCPVVFSQLPKNSLF